MLRTAVLSGAFLAQAPAPRYERYRCERREDAVRAERGRTREAGGRRREGDSARDGSGCDSSLALEGGPPRKVTDFVDQNILFFDRSVDGKSLIIARGVLSRDAVMIRNFR